MNLLQMANYPFLKESVDYLRENGPSLDELLYDIAYERTRGLGKERVLEALEKGKIDEHSLISDADQLVELLSYIIARILVSCINDPYLTRRYALSEAKTAGNRLSSEDIDFIALVASELGLEVDMEDGVCKIHFIHFIKNNPQRRSKPWKFVDQDLRNGYVVLKDKVRLARVSQQALQFKIESELPTPVNDQILNSLDNYIKEIKTSVEEKKNTFKPQDLGKIRVTKLPPCMRTLIAKVQAGENLPHSGRFALTAFLHSIGMSSDEVMQLFASSPDFDESKTRYQIEHITGKISGTEYTPPECSTMKSYGICFGEDGLCKKEWMTHPLKYYRVKDKGAKKAGKKDHKE
ncbi:MAG: DNA primase large subunit PriL [Methanomassiliicoccales archaeon]|nr:MAG: DNA primase large subunit PriL [Methanomassiliicoccales archaeon]